MAVTAIRLEKQQQPDHEAAACIYAEPNPSQTLVAAVFFIHRAGKLCLGLADGSFKKDIRVWG